MESYSDDAPLVVIVGQTASGKTALSLELARRFNGEIIAADSRTVYKGMDIGTAKPTAAEMQGIPHHLIDVVSPDEPFNVHEFQKLARNAIKDIRLRGKLPIMVGGTGLYVDSVIFDYHFSNEPADAGLRQKLEGLTVGELQTLIIGRGLHLPENERNPRHLIRVLERGKTMVSKRPLRPHTLVIGMQIDQQVLIEKVQRRVRAMVEAGLVDEVWHLGKTYGWDSPALQAPAYKAFRLYVAGQITLEAAEHLFVRQDLQYAKRQKTWFKRNKSIHWISKTEEAVDLVTTFLNK